VLAIGSWWTDAIRSGGKRGRKHPPSGCRSWRASKKRPCRTKVSGPVSRGARGLCAVVVPTAFRQRHPGTILPALSRLTIAVPTVHQRFKFLTAGARLLSAICASRPPAKKDGCGGMESTAGLFLKLFNKGFERTTNGTPDTGGTVRPAQRHCPG